MKAKAVGTRLCAVALACAVVAVPAAALGGCAPKDASDGGATSADVAVGTWSVDADCASCHVVEGEACAADEGHGALPCMTCHADEAKLADVHADVEAGDASATRLKKTSVENASCTGCHDMASVAEATASTAELVDENGTAANPHALPQSASHDTVECSSCHALHQGEPSIEDAMATCTSCHHKDVFECYTCHD